MKETIASEQKVTLGAVYLIPSSEGGVTLRSASQTLALRGEHLSHIFSRLLPLLDGSQTLAMIRSELSESFGASADNLVNQLIEIGVIEPSPDPDDGPQLVSLARLLHGFGGSGISIDTIRESTILVAGEGPLIPGIAVELAGLGVKDLRIAARTSLQARQRGQSVHFVSRNPGESISDIVKELISNANLSTVVESVQFPSDVLSWREIMGGVDAAAVGLDAPLVSVPWVENLNKASIQEKLPWTSGSLLDRSSVHLGPSIIPGESACWKCFERRFRSNMKISGRLEEFEDYIANITEYLDRGSSPTFAAFLAPLVAFETIRLLIRDSVLPAVLSKVVVYDTWSYNMETHDVLKLPRCSHCSPVTNIPAQRLWA